MRKSKSFWILPFLVILAFSIFLNGCNNKGVIAKYTGGEITENEFKNFTKVLKTVDNRLVDAIDNGDQATLDLALNYMIMTRYISSQVKDSDAIKKTATDNLTLFKSGMAQQMGGQDKVTQYLTQQSVSDAELQQFFLEQAKLENYFSKDVTEADKKKKFDELKANGSLTLADVRHILIGTDNRTKEEAKKKADQLVQQLRGGADFATLAKANSDDTGSKDNGGLYTSDQLPLGSTDEPFRKAVMSLPLNQISDPVEGAYGYYIIRVEKRNEMKYEDVAKDLVLEVAKDRQNDFMTNKLKPIIKQAKVPDSMVKKANQQPATQTPGTQTPATQQPSTNK